ncbi:hypothetical protein M3919_003864 [Vibrio parahaemolyticus]|nr:hypothetical protein [Vibrio parahaemolyticus]
MNMNDEAIIAKAAKLYIRQVQFGWIRSGLFFIAIAGYLAYQHWFQLENEAVISYITVPTPYNANNLKSILETELNKQNVKGVLVNIENGEINKIAEQSGKEVFWVAAPQQ